MDFFGTFALVVVGWAATVLGEAAFGGAFLVGTGLAIVDILSAAALGADLAVGKAFAAGLVSGFVVGAASGFAVDFAAGLLVAGAAAGVATGFATAEVAAAAFDDRAALVVLPGASGVTAAVEALVIFGAFVGMPFLGAVLAVVAAGATTAAFGAGDIFASADVLVAGAFIT